MAKLECKLHGDFFRVLEEIDRSVMSGSLSASIEDGSNYSCGGVLCAVRVYERYSIIGKNRVSLNVTLIGCGSELFLSAIASGGSQAVLLKINTIGEEAFLNTISDAVAKFRAAQ